MELKVEPGLFWECVGGDTFWAQNFMQLGETATGCHSEGLSNGKWETSNKANGLEIYNMGL